MYNYVCMYLYRYGHGYELYCVSASPDGKLIASACKVSFLLLIFSLSDVYLTYRSLSFVCLSVYLG